MKTRLMTALLCLILLQGVFVSAGASGTWYTFTEDAPPEQMGYLVNEYTGTVTVTFLGDCTWAGRKSPGTALSAFSAGSGITVTNSRCAIFPR